jgi:hypothetical protein
VAEASVAKSKTGVPAGMMKAVMAVERPGFPRRCEDPRGQDHDPKQEATSDKTAHGKLRCQGDRSDE